MTAEQKAARRVKMSLAIKAANARMTPAQKSARNAKMLASRRSHPVRRPVQHAVRPHRRGVHRHQKKSSKRKVMHRRRRRY
jgi:hypothetical protein